MRVILEKKFLRKFKKIDNTLKLKVIEVLEKLERGEIAKLDIKKMKGYKNVYRIRLGNFRMMLKKEKDLIKVFDIEKREKAYR